MAGAHLATGPLDDFDFDFAVAVLPAPGRDDGPLPPALYVEIGVVLGYQLPLIVLTDSPDQLPADLNGLAWTVVGLDNADNLRLHLGLFLKTEVSPWTLRRIGGLGGGSDPALLLINEQAILDFFRRLRLFIKTALSSRKTKAPIDREPETSGPDSRRIGGAGGGFDSVRGLRFERMVLDLLTDSDILIEENNELPEPDGGIDSQVDAAAIIPGTERVLGPVLVEIKSRLDGRRSLQDAEQQLLAYLRRSGATVGLLIYDGPCVILSDSRLPIVALHIDELRQALQSQTLGRLLVRARNELVHGRPGEV
jgi:hypothetical protein